MPEGFSITIVYNGDPKTLDVNPNEQMQAVLQRAINLFNLQRQVHQMGLFTDADVQVAGPATLGGPQIEQSVNQAGLVTGQMLVLKQVVIQGGW